MRHRTPVDHLMDLNVLRRFREPIRGRSFVVIGLCSCERQMVENDWLILSQTRFYLQETHLCILSKNCPVLSLECSVARSHLYSCTAVVSRLCFRYIILIQVPIRLDKL